MTRIKLVVLLLLLAANSSAVASRVVSAIQARQLAETGIRHYAGMEKFPNYRPDLNQFDGKDGKFYFFEQIDDTRTQGSAHIRSIAVNKLTGDVWEVDGICDHMWPLLPEREVAALKGPRRTTPWECEKTEP